MTDDKAMDKGPKNTALVVGGGVAGMQAALVLAERGHQVLLAEPRAALGGLFPLLDNQFPTQSCGVCFMACKTPTYCPFVQCELHKNVRVFTSARVTSVSGAVGDFTVGLDITPTSVDNAKCTDCGACEAVCPVEADREFGDGLEKRKAIYRTYPKAVGKGYAVDRSLCTRCGKCVEACDARAIDLDQAGRGETVSVGAVILAPGADTFDASLKGEYGFGRYQNVLSAVKFERMLAAGSPSAGMPVRISDGKPPTSLAFIQCVGSRDPASGSGHCSSVCCMFTLKQALFARERLPDAKITVYYMDLRAFGKDYERYIGLAQNAGIEFVRAIPSVVRELPGGNDLSLTSCAPGGKTEERSHSLLVLATGFACGEGQKELASLFGLKTDSAGLIVPDEFSPVFTGVPGVFAAGVFNTPKDIPESAIEGSAAAALAAACLTQPSAVDAPQYPAPADFLDEEPKLGIVLCECEGYSSKLLDFNALDAAAKALPGVAFVEKCSHACSKAGMAEIRNLFAAKEPNRLLLASCTERIVGDLYRHMFKEMGIHPGVFEAMDLRGAARSQNLSAAKEALASSVASLTHTGFSPATRLTAQDSVLVIGGGPAGLSAASALANLGHPVHLVEKTGELGGTLKTAHFTVKGGDPASWLSGIIHEITDSPLVKVYKNSTVAKSRGRIGHFQTLVETREGALEVIHGAALIATGASEVKPKSYSYGQSGLVVTQREFEARLARNELPGGRVVMIQCVESREEAPGCRTYCSRVCCTHALKNSLELLKKNPNAQVTVLYRDLRSYGRFETAYEAARKVGVLFTPFALEARPQVAANGSKVVVRYTEPSLGEARALEADLLVLSTGMAPDHSSVAALAALFGVEADAAGFFREKSPKAATADFVKPGLYLAGTAHAPKHAEEAIAQGLAAAGRLSALLAGRAVEAVENPSYVVQNLCSRCGLCVETCPYGARSLDFEVNAALVDPILCAACGGCTTVCPNKAARQYGALPGQLLAALDELL